MLQGPVQRLQRVPVPVPLLGVGLAQQQRHAVPVLAAQAAVAVRTQASALHLIRQIHRAPNQPHLIPRISPRCHRQQAAVGVPPDLTSQRRASAGKGRERPMQKQARGLAQVLTGAVLIGGRPIRLMPYRQWRAMAYPSLMARVATQRVESGRLAGQPSFATWDRCRKWQNRLGGRPNLNWWQVGPLARSLRSSPSNWPERDWRYALPLGQQQRHQARRRLRTGQSGIHLPG